IASSTELSTTSHTRWWRPRSPVDPMYMPGRLRTASRPSRTWMAEASYDEGSVRSGTAGAGVVGVVSSDTDHPVAVESIVVDAKGTSRAVCTAKVVPLRPLTGNDLSVHVTGSGPGNGVPGVWKTPRRAGMWAIPGP